jgi:O-antigen/teichoic acid export membrane protein
MAAYTGKTFGTLLAESFLGSVDRLFLGKIAPTIAFDAYNIANNFGGRIQGLAGAVMGPVFHQTSRAVGKGSQGSAAAIFNETFDFTFGWYALAAIWTACWHPVFLRMWLGKDWGAEVAPAFTPMIIAFCLSGLASISTAQLGPLNRVGVGLCFNIVNGSLRGLCVVAGWYWHGLPGAAWGFLISRIVTVAQDLYVIRLVGGGGWLAPRTWRHLLAQVVVGLAFFFAGRLLVPHPSLWEILPAALHGSLVAAWLSRQYVRKFIAGLTTTSNLQTPGPMPETPES